MWIFKYNKMVTVLLYLPVHYSLRHNIVKKIILRHFLQWGGKYFEMNRKTSLKMHDIFWKSSNTKICCALHMKFSQPPMNFYFQRYVKSLMKNLPNEFFRWSQMKYVLVLHLNFCSTDCILLLMLFEANKNIINNKLASLHYIF